MRKVVTTCYCKECGGDRIKFPVTAVWDIKAQELVIDDADDEDAFCADCKGKRIVFIEEAVDFPDEVAA